MRKEAPERMGPFFLLSLHMDIEYLYQIYLESRLVSTDSRDITPGCIFFALKGANFNGNQFAFRAIEAGASAAIVDEDPLESDPRIFKVEQVLTTLQELAAFHRKQSGFSILAITGSNGKTTTKELCRSVLSKKFRVFATLGNLNNHIGVPLTLLAMDPATDVGIVEMGANHPGEIRDLCAIAQPDFGLITNVGKAHLEGFGSIEGVARAKGELFEYLMTNHKTIFLNEGNEFIRKLVPGNYREFFPYNGPKGINIQDKTSNPFLKLKIAQGNEEFDLQTKLIGGYNAENVLAACCVGLFFQVPVPLIKEAVEEYIPRNNRSQLIDTGKNRLFMDAYNANPSSMRAAIDEFLLSDDSRKLLILGEMRELGDSSLPEHAALIGYLRDRKVSQAICIGNTFKQVSGGAGFLYFESVDELKAHLSAHPVSGYFILIKGSRANQLEKVVPFL
jgi:UDP-N-acetylmuramoyl-tripeptide--D-alanyl-D-alanine ligase